MIATDVIWLGMACILFASFGGLARVLSMATKQPVTRTMVFKEVFLSAFAGCFALLICIWKGVEWELVGAICGVFGFIGIESLKMFGVPIIKKVFGIAVIDDKDQGKKD